MKDKLRIEEKEAKNRRWSFLELLFIPLSILLNFFFNHFKMARVLYNNKININ